MIAQKQIPPLIIIYLTYLSQYPRLKSNFFSNSLHYLDPIGTGFKLWIFARISWNRDFDTRTSAIWNVT